MRILDPGHLYELQTLDEPEICPEPYNRQLRFVKREGPNYPGNSGTYPGTIIQEVLRCCIDRLKYVNSQIPHPMNWLCIQTLRSVIFMLEWRAAERHGRTLTFEADGIERWLPCATCGHIGCNAGNHQ